MNTLTMLRRRARPHPAALPRRRRVIRSLVRRLGDERGFSITELLITMSILGTIVAGFGTVFVSTTKAETDMNLRFQAQQEARLALDQLRRETHAARCVTAFNTSSPPVQMAPGVAARQIELTYGPGCEAPTARRVTWCVAGAGNTFSLHRRDGAPAAACTGKRVATMLTQAEVFTVVPPSATTRATLRLAFRVSADGGTRAFSLDDGIVLRNSPRS
jgi:prepilin-type N-terminal cleavage/methylation domain-containing protein